MATKQYLVTVEETTLQETDAATVTNFLTPAVLKTIEEAGATCGTARSKVTAVELVPEE
jgi:hypothetical protein